MNEQAASPSFLNRLIASLLSPHAPSSDASAQPAGGGSDGGRQPDPDFQDRPNDPAQKSARPRVDHPDAFHGRKADLRRIGETPPSFLTFLPFRDFDSEHGVFVFDDGRNCGVLFEITPYATEARSHEELETVAEVIAITLREALPEAVDAPWIVQAYATNERSLYQASQRFEEYIASINPKLLETQYTQEWIRVMRAHLEQVGRPEGIFHDKSAKSIAWSGKQARHFITLYRMHKPISFLEAVEELNKVANAFSASMRQGSIGVRRCTARDLYEWLFPWLSPMPASTNGDPYRYVRESQIYDTGRVNELPDEAKEAVRGEDILAGYDLGDSVVLGHPVSDEENQCWWFNGMPHRLLTMQQLTRSPHYGHLTAERAFGDAQMTLLDQMPEGTTFVQTIIIKPQHEVRDDLEKIQVASRGNREESRAAKQEAQECAVAIEAGNKMYPMEISVYVRGRDLEHLNRVCSEVTGTLRNQGMRMLELTYDFFPVHKYVQQLPFAYRYDLDRKRTNRARLTFSRQIARIMPVYGRGVGTGNPGLMFFNRGAEPLTLDPIKDRNKNAHALILGPSGSGKSAFINGAVLNLLAVHRPRVFIIDPSASFGPITEYCASLGLTTSYLRVGAKGVTFNPYADALELLNEKNHLPPVQETEADGAAPATTWDAWMEDEEDLRRDLMGEMIQKTQAMVLANESLGRREGMKSSLKGKLREVIMAATCKVAADNEEREKQGLDPLQVTPSDVRQALEERARLDNNEDMMEMAYALANFCGTDTLGGRLFDSQGEPMPESDVTVIEFGQLANERYRAEMIVAVMSMFDRIHYLVEKNQHDSRMTLIVHDEVHVQLKQAVLAPYIMGIVKLWRKLGAWYWPATQDFQDISDNAKGLLNNLEWTFTLQMGESDVKDMNRFRTLTDDDVKLLLAPTKQPGDYVEGVVIRRGVPDIRMLFRSVLPPIALALAGTEKEEKAKRQELIKKHNLGSYLEANLKLAELIAAKRGNATRGDSIKKRWQEES